MTLKNILILALFTLCVYDVNAQDVVTNQREKLSLDKGWLFYEGDIPFPEIKGHGPSYFNAKAGMAPGAASPQFNDSTWQQVKLPHDWAIENKFDSTGNVSQSYRKRGIGWYRRHFTLDSSDRGKHFELQFDGIATYATIWINGNVVHRNWCGYTSAYIDITAFVKYGNELNTIAVKVDANSMEGWWYEGAGIYRHAWLLKRFPLHIITDGVYAQPIKKTANWLIPASVTIENTGHASEQATIELRLLNKENKQLAVGTSTVTLDVLQQKAVSINLSIDNPTLWSLENPYVYRIKTSIRQQGKVLDEVTTTCGFRTIKFTADSGFYLNNKWVKLKGVCNHQDHAGVGNAVPDALWSFRLKKLKEMGANAYRCAHNPPSNEFLAACDSMGILVMDENRNFNTSPEYINQLQWMIKRDRNYPSVILWSVFNEEPTQGTEMGYEMVRRMRSEVRKLDTTRPVTAAMNGGFFEAYNVSKAVDVVGFNYEPGSYDRFHKENPTVPMTSSEDVSAFMTRGEYVTEKQKNVIGSYDTEHADWGLTHREAWKKINERRFVAGAFIWSGFDYHGEPSPHQWPSASSFFGAMDLCGFPKTAYYIHQAQWRKDKPVLQVVPHWNYPDDNIGKLIKVMIISNADSVSLQLNGKFLGGQKADPYEMNTWLVPYQPGRLDALGYKNGKIISAFMVETTGPPVQLRLSASRGFIQGEGTDALPITVEVLDSKGRTHPTAHLPISFSIKGPANIIGVGNGDPNSHEPEKGNKRSLFNGVVQVIIQSKENSVGEITLTASSPGVKPSTIKLTVNKKEQVLFVPVIYKYKLK